MTPVIDELPSTSGANSRFLGFGGKDPPDASTTMVPLPESVNGVTTCGSIGVGQEREAVVGIWLPITVDSATASHSRDSGSTSTKRTYVSSTASGACQLKLPSYTPLTVAVPVSANLPTDELSVAPF